MKRIVYTCVTNRVDKLAEPLVTVPDCAYLCFTDQPFNSSVWEMRPLLKIFDDPRKTARYHKTVGCNEIDADMTIWQDGKIQFTQSAECLFDVMGDHTVSLFRHPKDDCVYEECRKVVRLRKDNHLVVKKQMAVYREAGHPINWGLFESAVVVRNNSKAVGLNDAWWREIESHSIRDQISLPYVLRKHGIDFHVINLPYRGNVLFSIREHPITNHYLRLPVL